MLSENMNPKMNAQNGFKRRTILSAGNVMVLQIAGNSELQAVQRAWHH